MKKVLALLFAFTLVVTLGACGRSEDEWLYDGYAHVHGHYVGVVNIEVDEDGVIESIWLDEYYLPYHWARVSADHAGNDDVLEVTMRGNTVYFAKYIKIGDKLFTGAPSASGSYVEYTADGIDDFYAWIDIEENANWYVNRVQAEEFYLANEDGSESDYERVEANSNAGMTKSSTDYWRRDDALGWDGNVEETIAAFVGAVLPQDPTLTRDSESGLWSVNDAETGATWSDFPDYFEVIKRAYNRVTE